MDENPPRPEFDLIERLAERAGERAPEADRVAVGIGDDGAVTVPGGATATSVDMLVEGVHFRRSTSPLRLIGRKALSVALSDLAAMGAEPGEAYVALGIPPDLDEAGCLELYGGLAEVASETGTALAGGDVSASPVLTIAVTVVGHGAAPERFVSRAGARPGHVLVVTGELGGAAAGLLLLERPELRSSLDEEAAAALVARQTDPTPRLAAGQRARRGRGRGDDRPQRRARRGRGASRRPPARLASDRARRPADPARRPRARRRGRGGPARPRHRRRRGL